MKPAPEQVEAAKKVILSLGMRPHARPYGVDKIAAFLAARDARIRADAFEHFGDEAMTLFRNGDKVQDAAYKMAAAERARNGTS